MATKTCATQDYEAEDMFHSTGGPSFDGGWNIWSNGFISTPHTFTPGPTELSVIARGEPAFGVAPHMIVSVDGTVVGDVFVTSLDWASYSFTFSAVAGQDQEIRIAFDNDVYDPPFVDRNLIIDSVHIDCADDPPLEPPSPCAPFCSDAEVISWQGSYQSDPLGAGAICRETTQPVAGGNCGNFAAGRQLFLNGTDMPCDAGNWPSLPAAVNGGYCVQTTAGDYPWAFLTLW
jgi:hypothetical protein